MFQILTVSAQRSKIKGSRVVTTEQKESGDFENMEVTDNLDVFLVQGNECAIEIEADDNLHEVIEITNQGGTLKLSASKDVTGAKKFSVKVTYTGNFKMVTAKGQSNITSLSDISVDNFTFKAFDAARIFATVRSKVFILSANDKTKTELNLSAQQVTIELSKNAQLKALISTPDMRFDMYQKSNAVVEGDVIDLKLRLDNNANFAGKGLTSKNTQLVMEGYANCSILVSNTITIEAAGKSEIDLYGEQVIDLRKFTENAVLRKKAIK